jgi:creatinine amidohydrolase
MVPSARSYALTDLSWVEIADHVTRESRLIVPVGSCDQFGPHLPVGAATVVVQAVSRDLSTEFGVLRAPLFPFGVNIPAKRIFPGSATLREKTLHRALNDLLADWEEHGFTEFILITAHSYEAHLEALATVAVIRARIRVINALAIEPPEGTVVHSKPEHAGEVLTSLLLHLKPELVDLEAAVDFPPPTPRFPALSRNRLTRIPASSSGSVGWPSRGTAAAGERIYAHLLQKIRERVFLSPDITLG